MSHWLFLIFKYEEEHFEKNYICHIKYIINAFSVASSKLSLACLVNRLFINIFISNMTDIKLRNNKMELLGCAIDAHIFSLSLIYSSFSYYQELKI